MKALFNIICKQISKVYKSLINHEKQLTLIMVFAQTLFIYLGVTVAIEELKGSEESQLYQKQAESWDIYKSNKEVEHLIDLYFEDHYEVEKSEEKKVTSNFMLKNGLEVKQMYTEYELCISLNRCDEDVLITLACPKALSLADYLYEAEGATLFFWADSNDAFSKYNQELNLYRFSRRCIPLSNDYDKHLWTKQLDKLAVR